MGGHGNLGIDALILVEKISHLEREFFMQSFKPMLGSLYLVYPSKQILRVLGLLILMLFPLR